MNILPKKRWHVRNQDNKDRVRRDEENARLEEEKERGRIALAEKEARMSLLRKRSNIADAVTDGVNTTSGGHINLFATEEAAGGICVKDNVEYMKEKKAEQESYEKKIGLLTYVGQSSMEAKGEEKMWYTQKKEKRHTQDSDSEVEEGKKCRLDPMLVVEKHLKHKKSKRNKKKKKKEKDKERVVLPSSSSSSKSIEKLREERLVREKVERERANQLLNKNKGDTQCEKDETIGRSRTKYFSQYNPDLARRKQNR